MRRFSVLVVRRSSALRGLSLIILAFSLIYANADRITAVVSTRLNSMRTSVVLDAGHGGVDPGANDGNMTEKEITLDVVLKIRDLLQRQGISVSLTRETDQDLSGFGEARRGRHIADLRERIRLLNAGRIGISVHVNASTDPTVTGALVMYASGSEDGQILGKKVITRIAEVTNVNCSKPIPRTNLLVLTRTNVPTILIEIGFLTNAADKQRMASEEYRTQLATAIAKGVIDYFSRDSQSS